ncbi:hypothetical protein SORBI_3008G134401 [Sorghum bicolor]|uniref:Uncharacterized protein n=1 Tax=Sorghum bicolor TaxID=4558 RepID=A0A1Z5R7M4_SORBI|nr:hypothetical protein SORBI_3008G134401 [Sorghum bicolor]
MPAAVTIVAGAASLAVAYGQLLSRPDDLALACAAFTAMYLMVYYAAQAMDAAGSSSGGGDGGGVDAERAPARGKRMALAMALVLYGLACAEVWDSAASREIAVAALASWCGAAAMLLVYLVVARASCCAGGCYSAVATDVP